MAPSTPFVDPQTSELDTTQIITESILLAKLIGFFVAIALVPFLVAILLGGQGGIGLLFVLASQFVLAIGSGIVLMYVISRAIWFSKE